MCVSLYADTACAWASKRVSDRVRITANETVNTLVRARARLKRRRFAPGKGYLSIGVYPSQESWLY